MHKALLIALIVTSGLAAQTSPETAQKLVRTYCVACHSEKSKAGNIALDSLKTDDIFAAAGSWEKVLRKVRTGEMPPLNLPRPKPEVTSSFVHWLESELDNGAKSHPNPGTPTLHRLNRAEYSNAVRDLVGLEMDHSATLPADDSGYGFDNIGDVLTVSPLLMEKYMATARRVSRLAVGTIKTKPSVDRIRALPIYMADDGELPLSVRGGMMLRRHFPVDAEYSILVRVRGNPKPNMPAPKLDIRVDGQRVKLFDTEIDPLEENQHTRNFEIRIPLKAGVHHVGAAFLAEYAKQEGGPVPPPRAAPPQPISLDYLIVGGPYDPTGPGETESRRRIFTCRPTTGGPTEDACAKQILTTLAHRAYRRPIGAADINPLLKLFAIGRQDGGTFEAGIETGVRAILMSPSFLFRVEQTPGGVGPGTMHNVSDIELASRLSFFLWSSIPDEQLLGLAEKGQLRANFEPQVRRMLADPKARSLVENFAGQWLHLRNVAVWRPDPDKYAQFDDSLRYAMQRETELFFENIIHEDRPVLEFLNADYTFLNDRLARHYGVPGVRGGYFRRVSVPAQERGGILTHGSILTVTSYPTRTSPVLRGKWILENILASPPPPPPPDVPDLADSASISAVDLRKALEQHRAKAACASCHSRLDPLGFALENYDAVGKFRKAEGGSEIDSSGALPGGATFRGASGLKGVLMERQDQFVECLSEKLLTYALGRGLESYDLPTVRNIRREAAAKDYRFSALVLSVVNSTPFQMRRSPDK